MLILIKLEEFEKIECIERLTRLSEITSGAGLYRWGFNLKN